MSLWHAVILAILLNPDPPDPRVTLEAGPEAMQALKDVCICLDLWESQEGWGVFNSEVRWAWAELRCLKDLPPSSDYRRFPDSATAAALVSFNCDTQLWLESRAHRHPVADAALLECKHLRSIWDAVRIAGSQSSIRERRIALAYLKATLGPAEYHLGRLPPHVPAWAFAEVE